MSYKLLLPAMVACLGLGLYIGKTYYSTTQTKEIEKEVVRTDVVTVVKTVERPDGTKETTSTTTDKTVSKHDETKTATTASALAPQWHTSASASVARLSEISSPVYGIQVERRLLGPFSVGLRAQTDKYIGVALGFEF